MNSRKGWPGGGGWSHKLRRISSFSLPLNIGFKLISFVILAVLLTGFMVSFTLINMSRDSLRQQVLENNLSQAQLAADFASNYVGVVEAHVQVFANRPDIRLAIFSNTQAETQPALAQFVEVQKALNNCALYDPNGIQTASYVTTTVGQSFADREWFQQVSSTHLPYLGLPIQSRVTGELVLPYIVPILDENKQLRGMVGAGIRLTALSEAIVNINYGSDTRASLMDNRDGGWIIANTDPNRIYTKVSGANEAAKRAVAGQRGSIETTSSQGELDLIGYTQVGGLPWSVMVITPTKTALGLTNSLTHKAVYITVIVVILTALLSILIVLGLIRPIKKLAADTVEIGKGNLDYKLARAGTDEIGDLSRSFELMALNLKTTMVNRDMLAEEVDYRKQAEAALKESLAFSSALMDNTPYPMFVTNEDTSIKFVNPAFRDLTGFSDEELIGQKTPYPWRSTGSITENIDIDTDVRSRASYFTNVERLYHKKTGEEMWIVLNTRRVGNGPGPVYFINAWLNITERKNFEIALKTSELRFRELFNRISSGVAIYKAVDEGRDFVFVDFNPAAERIENISRAEVLYRRVTEVFPGVKKFGIFEVFQRVWQSGAAEFYPQSIYVDLRIPSSWRENWVFKLPSGEIVAVYNDVTERKLAEAKALEIEALKKVNQAKTDLLANVSHELRTPLASIKGYVETLIETDVKWSEEQKLDFLQSANKEADRLTFLIRDLLDMSRLDSGGIVLDKNPINVGEIFGSVSGVLSIIASKYTLEMALADDLPPVQADKVRISQVITNLVENATKFSPAGSPIVIEAKLNGAQVEISVQDSGIGMPPEVVARLFDRFYQAKQVVEGKTKGTGLGLAICKGIVEAHGGRIWVVSQEGKGAKFIFSVPVGGGTK